ncbi:MAG TPA: hypothetical protein VM348_02405 [Brevundimonas sp.]|nr:hypothetical protein [Brevundimonas sp.]
MSDKPLSDLVRQGWSVVGYTVTDSGGDVWKHNFLLSRQGAHKVLTVRKKMMGEGVVASEMEV